MDIWPDSVTDSLSSKARKFVIPPLSKITNYIYRNSDLLLITSHGFEGLINRDFDFSNKIKYFPNWSADLLEDKSDIQIPSLPSGFIIMIAGNLGESQNLDAIANAINELKDEADLKWVFVGNGSRKQWLEEFIEQKNLSNKVFMMGQYPPEAMPKFFKRANAMVVSLSPGFEFLDVTVPARLQSYMSAARPILGMVGTGGAQIIRESDCGYTVPPGDYTELASVIRDKVLNDKVNFEKKGRKGRDYFEKHFQLNLCIDNLEAITRDFLNKHN